MTVPHSEAQQFPPAGGGQGTRPQEPVPHKGGLFSGPLWAAGAGPGWAGPGRWAPSPGSLPAAGCRARTQTRSPPAHAAAGPGEHPLLRRPPRHLRPDDQRRPHRLHHLRVRAGGLHGGEGPTGTGGTGRYPGAGGVQPRPSSKTVQKNQKAWTPLSGRQTGSGGCDARKLQKAFVLGDRTWAPRQV